MSGKSVLNYVKGRVSVLQTGDHWFESSTAHQTFILIFRGKWHFPISFPFKSSTIFST